MIRTIAMPADANFHGDIFGGWLVSQMDLGGAILAGKESASRVVTVGIETMSFVAPVNIGDVVSCYAKVLRIGTTSIAIRIEAWVERHGVASQQRVTHGDFTYVAIDSKGAPHAVKR